MSFKKAFDIFATKKQHKRQDIIVYGKVFIAACKHHYRWPDAIPADGMSTELKNACQYFSKKGAKKCSQTQ